MESFNSMTLNGKGVSVCVVGKSIKLGFSRIPGFLEIINSCLKLSTHKYLVANIRLLTEKKIRYQIIVMNDKYNMFN